MRKFMGVATLLAGLALVFSAGTMAVSADPGNGKGAGKPVPDMSGKSSGPAERSPAGNNGTVKVHDASAQTHSDVELRRNMAHVGCVFHLYGFHFDARQSGTYEILEWAPTGDRGTNALSGSWTATAQGDWKSGDLRLDGGHYRLNFYTYGGHAKHKMFWVEPCTTGGNTTGGNTTGGNTTGGNTTGGNTTGGTTTGGTTIRVETTTVVEGGLVRITRIFNNGVLVNEIRTVLGIESGSTGGVERGQLTAAGSVTAPAALAALGVLPSTATSPDAVLGLLGLAITTAGAVLMRRHRRS